MMHQRAHLQGRQAGRNRGRPEEVQALYLGDGRTAMADRGAAHARRYATSTSITATAMRCRASNLTLDHGVLSVVGRNGMGKTTLCNAIMGLVPVSSRGDQFRMVRS